METKKAIIEKEMMINFQQYDQREEVIEVSDSPSPQHSYGNGCDLTRTTFEQPIDLSVGKPYATTVFVSEISDKSQVNKNNQSVRILIHQKNDSIKYGAGSTFTTNLEAKEVVLKEEHFMPSTPNAALSQTNSGETLYGLNKLNLSNPYNVPPAHNKASIRRRSDHKPLKFTKYEVLQVSATQTGLITRTPEVLNIAKSIFSKRTRTLYQWMYPTASRDQLRMFVSTTWDNMTDQEKNIYIAQVLERSDKIRATRSLMVNPQLSQIKPFPSVTPFPRSNRKTNELQNAISSISNETCTNNQIKSPVFIPDENATGQPPQKRRRLTKKKLVQNLSSASQEFRDDPELSEELAQFSFMFKNQL